MSYLNKKQEFIPPVHNYVPQHPDWQPSEGFFSKTKVAKMTRKHNDSNVICLQGRPFVKKNIFAMLNAYFDTEFEEGRHLRRIKQL